jgi:hypothetical protein
MSVVIVLKNATGVRRVSDVLILARFHPICGNMSFRRFADPR